MDYSQAQPIGLCSFGSGVPLEEDSPYVPVPEC
jgi:hypothetical protein